MERGKRTENEKQNVRPHQTEARKARAKAKTVIKEKTEAEAKTAAEATKDREVARAQKAHRSLDAADHPHRARKTLESATGSRRENARTETHATSGTHLSVTSLKRRDIAKMATTATTYIRRNTKRPPQQAQHATKHHQGGTEKPPQKDHQNEKVKINRRTSPREKQKLKQKDRVIAAFQFLHQEQP